MATFVAQPTFGLEFPGRLHASFDALVGPLVVLKFSNRSLLGDASKLAFVCFDSDVIWGVPPFQRWASAGRPSVFDFRPTGPDYLEAANWFDSACSLPLDSLSYFVYSLDSHSTLLPRA